MDELGWVWSGIDAPPSWLSEAAGWADALDAGGRGAFRRVLSEARTVMATAGLQQVWLWGAPFVPRAHVVCGLALAPQRWLLGVVPTCPVKAAAGGGA